jgi:hypothetical protein
LARWAATVSTPWRNGQQIGARDPSIAKANFDSPYASILSVFSDNIPISGARPNDELITFFDSRGVQRPGIIALVTVESGSDPL